MSNKIYSEANTVGQLVVPKSNKHPCAGRVGTVVAVRLAGTYGVSTIDVKMDNGELLVSCMMEGWLAVRDKEDRPFDMRANRVGIWVKPRYSSNAHTGECGKIVNIHNSPQGTRYNTITIALESGEQIVELMEDWYRIKDYKPIVREFPGSSYRSACVVSRHCEPANPISIRQEIIEVIGSVYWIHTNKHLDHQLLVLMADEILKLSLTPQDTTK